MNTISHKTPCVVLALLLAMGMLYACDDASSGGGKNPSPNPSHEANRAPGAPENVVVVAGNTQLTIAWDAPSDTGVIHGDGTKGSITEYKIYYSETDGFDITDTTGAVRSITVDGSDTTATVRQLINGTTYYVAMIAINATGASPVSAQTAGTAGIFANAPPLPPLIRQVEARYEALLVIWYGSVDTGIVNGDGTEGTITGYKVYYSTHPDFDIDDTTGAVKSVEVAEDTTSYIIRGLTNGTAYYVVVTASNEENESAASEKILRIPAPAASQKKVPDAPRNVTALSEDTAITISWDMPVDTGITGDHGVTGTITKYKVYYSTNYPFKITDTTGVTGVEVDAATTTHTITGLTSGTTYYAVVTAFNATGESVPSDEQVSATPYKVPGAPWNVVAVPGKEHLTIAWDAPSDTGVIVVDGDGSGREGVITNYTVYYSTTDGFDIAVAAGVTGVEVDAATTTHTITGLTSGTTYYAVVTATNATGESVASVQVAGSPAQLPDRVPDAPRNIMTFAGDAALTVSWEAPIDTGIINGDGSTGVIVGYKIYYSTNDGFDIADADVQNSGNIATGTTTYDITNVVNETTYYVVVTALNATGESIASPQIVSIPGVLVAWSTYNKSNPVVQARTGTAIATVDELKAMTADGEYYLTTNIDLGAANWIPLHTKAVPFTGTLHGNGYILYNLTIDNADAAYQGLFATLSSATIENLGVGVESITVANVAGSLAGIVSNTSVLKNIAAGSMNADSTITATGMSIGGLVGSFVAGSLINGWNENLDVNILDVNIPHTDSTPNRNNSGGLVGYNDGEVAGTSSGNVSSVPGSNVGGLVGYNDGEVTGTASGNVSSVSGSNVGGLVGYNDGEATGTASGNVSSVSGSNVGGLVGIHNEWWGYVTGVASGNVSSQHGNFVGGLVGMTLGFIKGYSTGWVTAGQDNTSTNVGAVVGINETAAAITDVYYNSEGGDHVGTIGEASTTKINQTAVGATGERGSTSHGIAINGIASATATLMTFLPAGTEVGQWTFTAGQWPKLNLPDGVTDFMDYTTSPSAPANFVD